MGEAGFPGPAKMKRSLRLSRVAFAFPASGAEEKAADRVQTQKSAEREMTEAGKAALLPKVYDFVLTDETSFEVRDGVAIAPIRSPNASPRDSFALWDTLEGLAQRSTLDDMIVPLSRETDDGIRGTRAIDDQGEALGNDLLLPPPADSQKEESALVLSAAMTKASYHDFCVSVRDSTGLAKESPLPCPAELDHDRSSLSTHLGMQRSEENVEDFGIAKTSEGPTVLAHALAAEASQDDSFSRQRGPICLTEVHVPSSDNIFVSERVLCGVSLMPLIGGDSFFVPFVCEGEDCFADLQREDAAPDQRAWLGQAAFNFGAAVEDEARLSEACQDYPSGESHYIQKEVALPMPEPITPSAFTKFAQGVSVLDDGGGGERQSLSSCLADEMTLGERLLSDIFLGSCKSFFLSTSKLKGLPTLEDTRLARQSAITKDCEKMLSHNVHSIYLDWSLLEGKSAGAWQAEPWFWVSPSKGGKEKDRIPVLKRFKLCVSIRKESDPDCSDLECSISLDRSQIDAPQEPSRSRDGNPPSQTKRLHPMATPLTSEASAPQKQRQRRERRRLERSEAMAKPKARAPAAVCLEDRGADQSVVSNSVLSRVGSDDDISGAGLGSQRMEATATTNKRAFSERDDFQHLLSRFCGERLSAPARPTASRSESLAQFLGGQATQELDLSDFGKEARASALPDFSAEDVLGGFGGGRTVLDDLFKPPGATSSGPSLLPRSRALSPASDGVLSSGDEDFLKGLGEAAPPSPQGYFKPPPSAHHRQGTSMSWDSRSILENWSAYRSGRHYSENAATWENRKRRRKAGKKAWGKKRL